MTSCIVEPIQIEDLADVAAIHLVSFDDPWDTSVLQRILAMRGAFGLVARTKQDGQVAGFALARTAADECELLSLGVAIDYRRQGVGRALLTGAMDWACGLGARHFFLEVAEDNDPALDLYAAHGLVPVGRRPKYYELKDGGYAAALTMRRSLSEQGAAPD